MNQPSPSIAFLAWGLLAATGVALAAAVDPTEIKIRELAAVYLARDQGDLPAAKAAVERLAQRHPNDSSVVRMMRELDALARQLAEARLPRVQEVAPAAFEKSLHSAGPLAPPPPAESSLASPPREDPMAFYVRAQSAERTRDEEATERAEADLALARKLARSGQLSLAFAVLEDALDSLPASLQESPLAERLRAERTAAERNIELAANAGAAEGSPGAARRLLGFLRRKPANDGKPVPAAEDKVRLLAEALRARDAGNFMTAKHYIDRLRSLGLNADPTVTQLHREIEAKSAAREAR